MTRKTELNRPLYVRIIQGVIALIAALFGFAAMVVGVRVLAGPDPRYVVYRPLLIYNNGSCRVSEPNHCLAAVNSWLGGYECSPAKYR
jgi:hypothetical protein